MIFVPIPTLLMSSFGSAPTVDGPRSKLLLPITLPSTLCLFHPYLPQKVAPPWILTLSPTVAPGYVRPLFAACNILLFLRLESSPPNQSRLLSLTLCFETTPSCLDFARHGFILVTQAVLVPYLLRPTHSPAYRFDIPPAVSPQCRSLGVFFFLPLISCC